MDVMSLIYRYISHIQTSLLHAYYRIRRIMQRWVVTGMFLQQEPTILKKVCPLQKDIILSPFQNINFIAFKLNQVFNYTSLFV
jgi:hypothetical protein